MTAPTTANEIAGAMDLLRKGDAASARTQLQILTGSSPGSGSASAWFSLAVAQRALGDQDAMHAALDKSLELEPRELRALLLKSDTLAAQGKRRAALTFYGLIVKLYPDPGKYPPPVAAEIRRAHETHARLERDVFQRMQAGVAAAGFREGSSSRFAQSLALLQGKSRRYEQEPRSYFFPELPTVTFYDRTLFPWMDALEAATSDIRAELQGLLAGPNVFAPYIEAEANMPVDRAHPLLDSPDWTASYLCREGRIVPQIADRCPRTMAAVAHAPLERIKGRAPFILFSKLTPGAWIRPHTGFLNTRLVCHLAVIVSEKCWFRVGADVRGWEEGKCFAFNDTIEHEARNEGQGTRTVLIFNIWRPELTEEERRLVTALMESIDTI
jgi:aspartyl/asparaginyl beta-hydroxylase (cupin superfamily)